METDFVPASLDVARFELKIRHKAGQVGREDYFAIQRALIPGGSMLVTLAGRRLAGRNRLQGLDALARTAEHLHESSHLALWCAITELTEKENARR